MKLCSQFDSELPKYQNIALALLENFKAGGDALSRSQLQLAKDFEVNRLTVRHALEWLQKTQPAIFQSSKKYPSVSVGHTYPSGSNTLIGFPIFADSFADQQIQRLIRHFKLAETTNDELKKHGFRLDIQWVGAASSPDLEKIRHLCELWQAIIVEPLPGHNSIGNEHPFFQKKERLAMVGIFQETLHNCVFPDFYRAAQIAMEEFSRLGVKRILYTGSEHESLAFRLLPVMGAEKLLGEHPEMTMQFAEGTPEIEGSFSSVKNFFLAGGKCDAVLACNPYSSIGALRALADLKIRVPEDVQLIGIGRVPFGDFLVPKPTTISTDAHAVGQAVARMAMALIQTNGNPQPNAIIPMNLIVGETTLHDKKDRQNTTVSIDAKKPFQFIKS